MYTKGYKMKNMKLAILAMGLFVSQNSMAAKETSWNLMGWSKSEEQIRKDEKFKELEQLKKDNEMKRLQLKEKDEKRRLQLESDELDRKLYSEEIRAGQVIAGVALVGLLATARVMTSVAATTITVAAETITVAATNPLAAAQWTIGTTCLASILRKYYSDLKMEQAIKDEWDFSPKDAKNFKKEKEFEKNIFEAAQF